MGDGETRNEVSGSAANVVQGRDISGGVHIHHHAGTATVIPRQLPADTVHFTDREPQISRLNAWLASPADETAHINLIAGAGGVGKTSLAAHWAHKVREQFPDGDLYLDLRGYHAEQSLDADEALDRLVRAFDIPADRIPLVRDAKAALYRSLLHGRRMLILLDNAATAEQIRPLLPGSPTCRVLVTSRSQLPGLVAREGAGRMPLDLLSADRAIELLRKIAGAGRVDADPAAAGDLARHCGLLPLALRIAAERLAASPFLTPADLVGELAEERERLDALAVDGDDFATVRAVFSWSYHALSPDAARMFRLLSLPAGTDVSAAAASVLIGTSEAKARRLLGQLAGAHLLNEHKPQRYRFHDLLRVYASERAETEEPPEERRAALHRLATWYAHCALAAARVFAPGFTRIPMTLAEPHRSPPQFPDRLAALHWCDAERENIAAAIRLSADLREDELAWQLPVALFGYYLLRRPLTDWIATHGTGIAAARRRSQRLAEAWLLTSRAIAHRDLRRYEEARDDFEQALAAWRETGERWGEAWCQRDFGGLLHVLGRLPEAMEALGQALAMHLEEGDGWGEATASSMLAAVHVELGRPQEALGLLDRALAIREEQGDRRNVARVMSELGLVHGALGAVETAVGYLEQALPVFVSFDFWYGEAVAHERLGDVLAQAGRTEDAHGHWHAAVDLFDRLADPRGDDIRRRLT